MRQIALGTDAPVSKFCLYLPLQTRREKIGCETGSSKFQLLEKD